MRKYFLISTLFLGILLPSCGDTPLYIKSFSFEKNQWKEDVKPIFTVNIPDNTKYYLVTLTLRTTTDYPYNNFWFFMHAKSPNGEQESSPIEVKVANAQGAWLGEKSGSVVEHTLQFKPKRFDVRGKYTFTLEQRITDRTAKEITDVSLSVTEQK
jgi:gliding motility-associated lipoprotein GldH